MEPTQLENPSKWKPKVDAKKGAKIERRKIDENRALERSAAAKSATIRAQGVHCGGPGSQGLASRARYRRKKEAKGRW